MAPGEAPAIRGAVVERALESQALCKQVLLVLVHTKGGILLHFRLQATTRDWSQGGTACQRLAPAAALAALPAWVLQSLINQRVYGMICNM